MQYAIDANEREWRLTLSGTMADRDLLDLEGLIMGIDESSSVAPNWLVDLRPLSNIEIDYRSVSRFAHVLGRCSLMNTERVALLAGIPIQYGFARMFQILSENWQVEVGLFENEKDALNWLLNQTQ
jgi:hypothetical protein